MEAVKVINKMISGQLQNINVAQLGKVVNYDEYSRLSTIQPLVMVDEQPQSLLISVPVAKHVTELGVGDMVIVLFLDFDSDSALLSNQVSKPNSQRTHDISDAVVIGSIQAMGGAI